MSFPLTRAVALTAHPALTGRTRRVLAVLAARAAHDGSSAFPSVSTIARATRIDWRNVQRMLRALETAGLITPTGTSDKGTTVYQIDVAALVGWCWPVLRTEGDPEGWGALHVEGKPRPGDDDDDEWADPAAEMAAPPAAILTAPPRPDEPPRGQTSRPPAAILAAPPAADLAAPPPRPFQPPPPAAEMAARIRPTTPTPYRGGQYAGAHARDDDPPTESPMARGWRIWCEVLTGGGDAARPEEEAGVHQVVVACGLPATELAIRSFVGGQHRPRVDWLMERARKHRATVGVGWPTEHDHFEPLTPDEQAEAEADIAPTPEVDRGPSVAPSVPREQVQVASAKRFAELAEAVANMTMTTPAKTGGRCDR